jgi:uncharacterized GH25 family protein
MRKTLAIIAATVMLAACSVGHAHDINALASRLAVDKPGEKITVYLSWGHRVPVDDLLDASSVARYELVAPDGKGTGLKKEGLSLHANAAVVEVPGVYQVLVDRKPSVFTYVFDDEGNRVMKRGPKTAVKDGKIDQGIRSVQCGKAIISVGPRSKDPVKAGSQTMEIVPLEGPAGWVNGATLRFQVLLNGKPLSGGDLTARYIGFRPDTEWCCSTRINEEGVASVRPSQAGSWLLRVNVKRPTTGSLREQYDYESFTTTLTLEILP